MSRTKKTSVSLANDLIVSCRLMVPRVVSFKDIDSKLVARIFSAVTGRTIDSSEAYPVFHHIINQLSLLIHEDLNYLKTMRHEEKICCILEILSGVHKFMVRGERVTDDFIIPDSQSLSLRSPVSPSSDYASGDSLSFSCCCGFNGSNIISCCDCGPKQKEELVSEDRDKEQETRKAGEIKDVKSSQSKAPKIIDARLKRQLIIHQQNQNLKFPDTHNRSRSVQRPTEMQLQDLRQLKEENFALELGYRLHDVLRLEEDTQLIERKINRLNNDIFSMNRPIDRSIEVSVMRKMGANIKTNNNHMDKKTGIRKSLIPINDAIIREEKRKALIHKEIRHLNSLRRAKAMSLYHRTGNAILRNQRMTSARIQRPHIVTHSAARDLNADSCDHIKNAKDLLEVKRQMREREESERKQNESLVQAYEGLYESKRRMVQETILRQEKESRLRTQHNRHMLSRIRQEMRQKMA